MPTTLVATPDDVDWILTQLVTDPGSGCRHKEVLMPGPISIGSYREDDVSILLTDLSGTRHGGSHAWGAQLNWDVPAHLLPSSEYQPTADYLTTVRALLAS